ncbi:biotin carboxylase N-terminal domain-containing protein [Promicromonospora iranensis]|uniref:3-methylcrotonyl-CoA carboxylase alpha subunit/acetyl-CoA/propionyl-CoA carboxylase biotin carboxyl carrier protein n=1 Tax=Promicromonospora iranensis TaxID=1105144 RepID=A0ABU2CUZ1_9MICO|nr:biotin carboxylase N-terminal domain-containing protein [Promicromonospora iranensis]MDR7385154.1 3-methylcrotonyl-CoA carboxylase alpha subunit/acetyl-CoA/propionyl-CoA carboxylase biotin carboxyl carrier protein [Promicromonospora iranensis]
MPAPIHTLLIANRGEIALRIIRTARRLGLRTVAVYSDADRGALHTRAADVAVRIGPTPAAESYLSIPALLAAAKETGADAVHPGYGFLSEQADFARAVAGAGLTWVGPSPEAMDAMGRKDTARKIAEKAGVPVLRSLGDVRGGRFAAQGNLPFPLLVKAAAGGGGKGMRIVREQDELGPAIAAAGREAAAAFGDDALLLERYIERGRHVEVQILADEHGNVLHLHERDCSAQRRHQKVLEEAPAPDLDPALRDALHTWAVRLAREAGYTGVGTAEFLVEVGGPTGPSDADAWFLEMNTRLQVEHPVTEEVVTVRGDRIDLVAQQLRVAAGEELGFTQDDVAVHGHAIEARIYAEDAFGGFLPQAGTATRVRWPGTSTGGAPTGGASDGGASTGGHSVRVEAGLEDGTVVPAAYDPMVGKVIARGADRETARRGLVDALDATAIGGLVTNTGFVRALADSDAFRDGEVHTAWLDTHPLPAPDPRPAMVAAAWTVAAAATADGGDGWRLGGPPADTWVELDDAVLRVSVARGEVRREGGPPTSCRVVGGDAPGDVLGDVHGVAGDLLLELDGSTARFAVDVGPRAVEVSTRGHTFRFVRPGASGLGAAEVSDGVVLAAMPGTLARVEVSDGDPVTAGQPLGVLEAMKMEVALLAPADGVVRVRAAAGDQVAARQVLFGVGPADEQEATDG